MNIIGWIILGAIAGWLAGRITKNRMGILINIVVGIIGSFIGGFVFNLIGGRGFTGFNLWSLIVATIGSIILLLIINAVNRR